jgi:hypothetical protein
MTNPVYEATTRRRAKVATAAQAPEKRIEPQWKYRQGEYLTFDPRNVDDEKYTAHAGDTCQVLSCFDGYTDGDNKFHYTAGGCYYVGFASGARIAVFEHWLKRDDGTRAELQ